MSTPRQGDPFDEHADEFARPTSALLSPSEAPDTLAVGRLASLSLGEDTLVVLGEHRRSTPCSVGLDADSMRR